MIDLSSAQATTVPLRRGVQRPLSAAHAGAREAMTRQARAFGPVQPVDLGPDALVYGDLCDYLAVGRYCHQDAFTLALDCDGRERTLCADHAARFFPGDAR
jgi:hypothetical protein